MLEAPALTGATSQSWCALRGATALPAHDVAFADPGIAAQRDLHVGYFSSSPLAMRVASAMKSVAAARNLLDGVGWLQPLAAWRLGKSGVADALPEQRRPFRGQAGAGCR